MQKVYILKGLPGSGKSTWAKEELKKKANKNVRRINRDELRDLLWGSRHDWSGEKEESVTVVQEKALAELLKGGYDIIIDDTNLNPKTVARFKKIVEDSKQSVEIIEKFFDVSLKNCIKQDLRREHSVGKDVIMDMYNRYLRPKYTYKPGDKPAIIVDIDGTMAIMGNRGPFEWDKVDQDLPNEPVVKLVLTLSVLYNVIFLSGRDGGCYDKTSKWLEKTLAKNPKLQNNFLLFMRKAGDQRSDDIVKHELFETYINGKFDVKLILDDRDQVVDMWRLSYGLPCFQVNYGNF